MELTACADNSQLDKPSGLDELRQEPSDAAREQHVVPSRPSTGKGRIAAAPRTAGFDHVECSLWWHLDELAICRILWAWWRGSQAA